MTLLKYVNNPEILMWHKKLFLLKASNAKSKTMKLSVMSNNLYRHNLFMFLSRRYVCTKRIGYNTEHIPRNCGTS